MTNPNPNYCTATKLTYNSHLFTGALNFEMEYLSQYALNFNKIGGMKTLYSWLYFDTSRGTFRLFAAKNNLCKNSKMHIFLGGVERKVSANKNRHKT